MPNSKSDGRGQVKDPKNDGRLKENQGRGGSSASSSRNGGKSGGGSR
jgi:hypothetical protein